MSGIGILILAAGASTRLGQPKQLLSYQGKPLIRQMAEVAIASGCQPVGLVLGSNYQEINSYLSNLKLHIFYNKNWSTGMASSIQCGLKELLILSPELDAIVLMVCDQPFVSPDLIQQLIAGYQRSHYPIVASEYADILGVPALFDRAFFPDLFQLQGDRGAQSIIRQNRSCVLGIPFAKGVIDIDTPQNLSFLNLE